MAERDCREREWGGEEGACFRFVPPLKEGRMGTEVEAVEVVVVFVVLERERPERVRIGEEERRRGAPEGGAVEARRGVPFSAGAGAGGAGGGEYLRVAGEGAARA